jgi:hypothetical protein
MSKGRKGRRLKIFVAGNRVPERAGADEVLWGEHDKVWDG